MSMRRRKFIAAGAMSVMAMAATASASAQGVITTHRLSAPLASEAVLASVEHCKRMGYNVTAVLIDADGVRKATLRGDGSGPLSLDTAYAKASTALYYRTDTIELVQRMQNLGAASIQAKIPNLVIAQGGVVIKMGDEVIGAIGISGGPGQDYDTQCARAGIDKIRDRMK
jgi:uncharacterized protein GlcG (DUF336 family)